MHPSTFLVFAVAASLLVLAHPAHSQTACTASHCDIQTSRLAITGEDCATQTFDSSQTVEYSQLVTGATDWGFPVTSLYPISAFGKRLDGTFATDDPGFTSFASPCTQQPSLSPLPAEEGLYIDFLTEPPSAGGSARSLLYWDGLDDDANGLDENDVDWSPVPNNEIMRVIQGGFQATADGGTSEIEGLLVKDTTSSGGIHSHADFELRRNGGGLASIGVYLFRTDITMYPFAEGIPIYIVLATISTPADSQDVAVTQVENNLLSPLCSDGIDNDRDGLIDYAGGDPGCDSAADTSEKSPLFECDDGIDNDLDGKIDFRADDFGSADLYAMRDLQCGSPTDATGEATEPVLVPGLTPGALGLLCILMAAAGSRSLRVLRAPRS